MDQRSSGVLMHITSLPGRHGSGDLGEAAYRFIDFLAAAGQSWWQVLPHNPAGDSPGYSPYSSPSSFAGNPWFVSLDRLVEQGLLDRSDVRPLEGFCDDRVIFDLMDAFRDRALRIAFSSLSRQPPKQLLRFQAENKHWLEDWSLFAALRKHFNGKPWTDWPADIRAFTRGAVSRYRDMLDDEVRYHQFVQWQFHWQWMQLKKYAAARGIGLIGDLPIFVGHDSADVWSNQQRFKLNTNGFPKVVSGCPPDEFNVNGQVWNHPHYDWDVHKKEGFKWWTARFSSALELFDVVRVDHFLGFYRLWEVPFGAKNAVRGKWNLTPGRQLFNAVKKINGSVPVIAEDLGTVTSQAIELRDEFGFPGMHVLLFGCESGGDHLPHRYRKHNVAYTGTHDCDTVNGYVDSHQKSSRKSSGSRDYLKRMKLMVGHELENPAHDLIRILMKSVANTVIIPTQDILGLGSEARFNLPGTDRNNWHWRMIPGALNRRHAKWLRELVELTHRNNKGKTK